MPDSPVVASINGYHALPLELTPLPSFKAPATHYIYLRPHDPKYSTTDDDTRTLFAVNVPIDATEAHFRYLFANLGNGGRVDSVTFSGGLDEHKTPALQPTDTARGGKKRKRGAHDSDLLATPGAGDLPQVWDRTLHRSGSTALIKFVDRASQDAALKAVRKKARAGKAVPWGEGVEGKIPALGSQRYLNHHHLRYPSPSALRSSVDTYMTRYAQLEARKSRENTRLRQQPDEEGFVTVTRGGRAGGAAREVAEEAAQQQKQKGTTDLKDFYRFQVREERKKKQVDLVRKFEDDKRKVGEMKRQRGRFKPE
ncbi:MAG: UDP-N-acetylglucosamine pyrophosphorylase [Chaenotheca gracillima]|nr:MAG: UDP-N-acetylglucosamine pyrophosphorylase [Chaenotheca gracillima]